jgi:CRISPR-associated RAMP protein (TIGR02581 family)
MFDKIESRMEIAGWLVAESAFRVGSGRSTELTGTDLPVVRDATGVPYIPGSSFKGVLRSRLESFARAASDSKKISCNPIEEKEWCITADELETEKRAIGERVQKGKLGEEERDSELTGWIERKTCLACLTFGSPWLASGALIKDLKVDRDFWFDQFQVRDGVAIDRDTETAGDKKLYGYEVVPSGVRFELRIILENCKPWQWGMVFVGLKSFQTGGITLGGGKSRGLGWVNLDLPTKRLFSLIGADESTKLERLFSFADGNGFEDVTPDQIKLWVRDFKDELELRAMDEEAK